MEETFQYCGYLYVKQIRCFSELKAPEVGDSWTSVATNSLRSGLALSLEVGDWIYVRTLWRYTDIWIRDGGGRLLAHSVGRLNYATLAAGVYVVSADDASDVIVGLMWRRYGGAPPGATPRVAYGAKATGGAAKYFVYWWFITRHKNWTALADEVREVVDS